MQELSTDIDDNLGRNPCVDDLLCKQLCYENFKIPIKLIIEQQLSEWHWCPAYVHMQSTFDPVGLKTIQAIYWSCQTTLWAPLKRGHLLIMPNYNVKFKSPLKQLSKCRHLDPEGAKISYFSCPNILQSLKVHEAVVLELLI